MIQPRDIRYISRLLFMGVMGVMGNLGVMGIMGKPIRLFVKQLNFSGLGDTLVEGTMKKRYGVVKFT